MGHSMHAPRAYEINQLPADATQFVQMACDPARSVVVEACAGSGKTWLLVARMLRLLLAGAEPGELLAITFTRKAAQEMRERLLQLLHELALGEHDKVCTLLQERGIAKADIGSSLPLARNLYERVLRSPQALSIDTFHSWFAKLVRIAPLQAGVPHGYSLSEAAGELKADAFIRFMQSVVTPEHTHIKEALQVLYEAVGDWQTKRLLDCFLEKRAEWWAACREGSPLESLHELCGEDGQRDARLSLWDDKALLEHISEIAVLLGQGAKRNQERAVSIEKALTAGCSLESFAQLLGQFCDEKGEPRGNDHRRGKLLQAIEQRFGEQAPTIFEQEFNAIGEALWQLQRRSCELKVLALNEALFTAGCSYLDHYQAVKAERRVLDFADLEWHAYCLLQDEAHAAYLQSRLDARYKHILLDEFQDTNPLQWSIIQAWLNAYGDDHHRPSVFIVGDPKQSIYRFRRAEPRVFAAARDLLHSLGADILRTSQTRRNAGPIVEALNASFNSNPIFTPQTTLSTQYGTVWRLPLVRTEKTDRIATSLLSLRNPLTAPREEEDDMRRFQEGRVVARALLRARQQVGETGELQWSDVMLLVKKRTHLTAYESALREAGIPFVSDRRGGLLQSLEVADLIALLTFLITPCDNRALAHVLKSPIVGASDDDLILLAQRSEATWWLRLQAAAERNPSDAVQRAATLLGQWSEQAPYLPVHDLLDRIVHQGDLTARYAQAAPALTRPQIVGNIEAFIELALNLDVGRYPSLPRFIEVLRRLQQDAEQDAPDEADIDVSLNAVRVLTIHSAKGLEASIVALLDANHTDPMHDDIGILCDWPQDAAAPVHFSAFARTSERGAARDALFGAEDRLKCQEDWNLFYVAVTRAKQLLIVSGVAAEKSSAIDGINESSWYARLRGAHDLEIADTGAIARPVESECFQIKIFAPPALSIPVPVVQRHNSPEIEEGIALHAMLERVTQARLWPISLPETDVIARWLPCRLALAATIRMQAQMILMQPHLERFFNPAIYQAAHNEIEVMVDSQLLRFDRLVVFDDSVWILDYKRQLLDSERAAYRAQLRRYQSAAAVLFPQKQAKAGLITSDGQLWEFD